PTALLAIVPPVPAVGVCQRLMVLRVPVEKSSTKSCLVWSGQFWTEPPLVVGTAPMGTPWVLLGKDPAWGLTGVSPGMGMELGLACLGQSDRGGQRCDEFRLSRLRGLATRGAGLLELAPGSRRRCWRRGEKAHRYTGRIEVRE